MKIVSFSAKNFKSINEKGITINFAPITLLSGLNCSGKSNIIQAIHFAKEIVSNSVYLNPDEFEKNFMRALPCQDRKKQINFKFEFQDKISCEINLIYDTDTGKPKISKKIYKDNQEIEDAIIQTKIEDYLKYFSYSNTEWFNKYDAWKVLIYYPNILERTNNVIQKLFGDTFEYTLKKVSNQIVFEDKQGIQIPYHSIGRGISKLIYLLTLPYNPHGNDLFTIEYPESNIHPAYQVELAEFFLSKTAYLNQDNVPIFLIETNSEHFILRLLRRIREYTNDKSLDRKVTKDNIAIYYVQKREGMTEALYQEVTPDGDFLRHWPNGFFEERTKELF